ncbi:hypothetical protein RAJCM14343_5319 [Rhodococcus aetherivorans]|uniref:Uncharacterized protein n=1 Tax=Rhodococcus aetherivorans TaxID=191292 RepID=A0ABQ0YTR4_9NOCA|nr:hypothetical protein RR21198_5810 [Rhodococcus rhodochrous ATCC 21198]NGP25142.1 hypothetical protein [Rhodococcus aetherivorans]GES40041.1 hypothetical protein RAJCM14343_5319 [Rhodococcus aetherivorans]
MWNVSAVQQFESEEPERDEATTPSPEADLMVIADEFGTAVVGTGDAIEQFCRQWDTPLATVTTAPNDTLARMSAELFSTRTVSTAYAIGTAMQRQFAAKATAGTTVTFHRMVRDAGTGKILSHARIAPPPAAAAFGPAAAALAGLEMAIAAQFDRIDEHLDRIEDSVDEILRLASAQRLGDVYGHHRLLTRRVQALTDGAALTATDWSSIAALGADLEVGVERLRFHAQKLLDALDDKASPGTRADQLADVLRKGRLLETLQLLIVAQQSLFLWQRLRLVQVQTIEPQHLPQTIVSARATLSDQYTADTDLAARLRQVLDHHAVLSPGEAHHKLAGRALTKHRDGLAAMVEAFIAARNLQVEQWTGARHATLGEAWSAARTRTGAAVTAGRRRLARGAGAVATWVEPKQPPGSDDTDPAPAAEREQ